MEHQPSQTALLSLNNSSSDLIVSVAINVPLRRTFDYRFDTKPAHEPEVGMRVKVPFGSHTKIGLISEVHPIADYLAKNPEANLNKLKPVALILDEAPLVSPKLIRLYEWMVGYYHAPQGEIWQTLLPTALLKGSPTQYVRSSRWLISELGREVLQKNQLAKNAVKQKLILQRLFENPAGILHDRLREFELDYSGLKKLAGKNWVVRSFQKDSSSKAITKSQGMENIHLNSEQQFAIDEVSASLNQYQTFLLFGVTASGKTEVYLRLIEKVIEQDRQALVLVPEIGLTPQTLRRFQNRFAVEIVLMHSGMSEQQRLQSWLKARSGDAKIIIGTRSALFVPLHRPGIIIIDEEHDLSFRQQQGFRYSARDVAMVRGHLEKVPVLLGSASPSLESLMNVEKKKITQLNLRQKAQATAELSYQVIDLKKQIINNGLSQELVKKIKQHLSAKGQILLFLNRRGYAPVLLCHECGWSSSCTRCDTHFTYHHKNHFLQCHHCGSSKRAPRQCPECQCEQMIPVGLGTERLQETVAALFPDAKLARIDRDTTRKKAAMQEFVTSVKAGEVDILIGTQMLAKGHHFPDVTLVALIDMDGALYSADYRAPEYAAQLITQVSGRAGRAQRQGEVIIQTHLAEHPMLAQVIHQGYAAFANSALQERIEAEYPPYAFSAMFQAESPHPEPVNQFLQDVRLILDRYTDLKVELLGPAPSLYMKKAGKYRYQLFLQTLSRNDLHRLLDLTLPDIEKLKSANKVRWRLEIDPVGDS
ncbi:primosomal protein N' [Aliikangiella sp. IMCC44653]